MSSMVCPLGLCTTEDVCPNAPCLDCMRRLGEHMIEEIKVLQAQADVAYKRKLPEPVVTLKDMMRALGERILLEADIAPHK